MKLIPCDTNGKVTLSHAAYAQLDKEITLYYFIGELQSHQLQWKFTKNSQFVFLLAPNLPRNVNIAGTVELQKSFWVPNILNKSMRETKNAYLFRRAFSETTFFFPFAVSDCFLMSLFRKYDFLERSQIENFNLFPESLIIISGDKSYDNQIKYGQDIFKELEDLQESGFDFEGIHHDIKIISCCDLKAGACIEGK